MEDPRWLRLVTIGLVLSALAVGYFLLTGRLSPTGTKTQTQVNKAVSSPTPTVVPSVTPQPSPTPASAYSRIVERTQGGVQTLPKTGFPVGLIIVFSVSAMVFGLSLRRFPH